MGRRAAQADERQPLLFDDAPEIRVWRSDERALSDMRHIVETLAAASTHPWSARLLGWQLRTFSTLAQRVTPLEAAALQSRLDTELERLGAPQD